MFVCRRCFTIICDNVIEISNNIIIVEKIKTLNVNEVQFDLLICSNCDSNLGFYNDIHSATYNINVCKVIKIVLKR